MKFPKKRKEVFEMNTINDERKHVFFRRVSTAGQDIITQESADLPFRERLSEEKILIIN